MPETPHPPRLFGFPIVEHEPCTDPTCVFCQRDPIPITFSGVWDDGRETCITCQQRFTPGPEGTAVVTETATGRRWGVVCPSCGAAIVGQG